MSAMIGRRRRLLWLPLAAGFAMAALTVELGNWQLRRAAQQEAIEAQLARENAVAPRADAAPPAEWQTVSLEGTWDEAATIYLDNRTHLGRAGYHVLTPLHLADGSGWVLVDRGWVAAGNDRATLPAVTTPQAPQRLAGTVRYPEAAPFALTREPQNGRRWQYLDLARYRAWSGLPVAAWLVEQSSGSADGLVREPREPRVSVERHRGYAAQWYALAALALGLCARHGWNAWRRKEGDAADVIDG